MKKLILISSLFPVICIADINLSHDIWNISFERSEMNDSILVYMTTKSLEAFNVHGRSVRASMMIRCKDNKTEMFIHYPGIYLDNDYVRVEYRLDKDKSIKATWNTSTDYEATFVKKPLSVIKSMFDKDRMLVKVSPYSKSPITLPFNISGLKESIEPLRKACNW
ncbi:type VI secretion system-associated protein TagO [Pasteurella multocida]|uniref:type VI secretion system-associated protein TagO n=2 Tax=Pasteurella multocida TaxID=747 RepID=UPI0009F6950D|nr:type VI secretion system-associated protein TagO [Pasteurella multocida]MEB3450945.1 type VI secretion system-associated protein TagO [Pasteurella multocida]MEB3452642.1 type VI secretion system-associated protein TagO [Pasteurella multocida]MEB3455122.1 type VI secretion system-associated protein TagO [Pasteurella multocida]MEB3462378.1 type VI secretion system-associated protein TagO [Pasteurella multocida]PNM02406.1 hypothetical protein A6J89_000830 [Pasteurella multocida]